MSGTSTAPALSLRLREETRDVHESVEQASSFNRLIVVSIPPLPDSASATEHAHREQALREYREVYRRFLVAAHGFEAAVDRRLEGSATLAEARAAGYAPEPIEPVRLIREDLAKVFGAAAAEHLPVCDELPPIDSLPELVGTEYVRRGSRAGGAVISAVVLRNLGFDRESGASFLGAHGKRTRAVLTEYKEWMDGLALSESDRVRAVTAAREAFAAVERWHRTLEDVFDRG